MKILTILGARPQFIKAATISRAIEEIADFQEVIVHTGQHFDKDMSDIFFNEMSIPKPKYNLAINSLSHGAMTGRMLEEIEKIIDKENPNLVLVYGDTNSTLAGTLAAKKLHIKVAHVEAGLRSFNLKMPEEINRILTDQISDFLFCPTDEAVKNLEQEGFKNKECHIFKSGDVMLDAAIYYSKDLSISEVLSKQVDLHSPYILMTCHRAENTDSEYKLTKIIEAMNEINKKTPVVFPMHPRTKKKLQDYDIKFDGKTLDPVGYFDMINLIKSSKIVVTDSGGLQKEAYFFKKLCVTLRDQTEWKELVDHKFNLLSSIDKNEIIEKISISLDRNFPENNTTLYGSGQAAREIVQKISKIMKQNN